MSPWSLLQVEEETPAADTPDAAVLSSEAPTAEALAGDKQIAQQYLSAFSTPLTGREIVISEGTQPSSPDVTVSLKKGSGTMGAVSSTFFGSKNKYSGGGFNQHQDSVTTVRTTPLALSGGELQCLLSSLQPKPLL